MQRVSDLQYLIELRKNNPDGKFLPKSHFYSALDDLIDFYRRGFDKVREQQRQAYRDHVNAEWDKFMQEVK